jgi:hypothetical protein
MPLSAFGIWRSALVVAITLVPSTPHTRLFVPPALHDGRAEAYIVEASIDEVAAEYRRMSPPRHRSSFRVEAVGFLDAFDGAAMYDRARVARLYRGHRARLARGPVIRDGRVQEMVTLISPYPDARLERLVEGTLVIVLRIRQSNRQQATGNGQQATGNRPRQRAPGSVACCLLPVAWDCTELRPL